jgi:hypothetical protein
MFNVLETFAKTDQLVDLQKRKKGIGFYALV